MLQPGEVQNLTVNVRNNGSSIVSYDVVVDGGTATDAWNLTAAPSTIPSVIPTQNGSATIVIRLATTATPSDSGYVDIVVRVNGSSTSTSVRLVLTAAPTYGARALTEGIGQQGLLRLDPGTSTNVSIPVRNLGNVQDDLLLSVGSAPDLATWWANRSVDVTGLEGLLLLEPANSTQIDATSANLTIRVNLTDLAPSRPYHVDWALLNTTDSSMLSSGSQSVNSTQPDAEVVITRNETQRGWMDLRVNLTSNGTTLVSRTVRICLHDGAGCIAASPSTPGWDVRFLEQDLLNVGPNATRMTTLRVTIPADQPPGFHGFDLNVATTSGNTTRTSLLVIEVLADHRFTLTWTGPNASEVLPGGSTTRTLSILNTGSASTAHIVDLSPTDRAWCTTAMRSTVTEPIPPGATATVIVQVRASSSADVGEVCTFSATVRTTQDANVIQTLPVTIDVGQQVAFSIEPLDPLTLTPGVASTLQLVVVNNGSEADAVRVTLNSTDELVVTGPTGWVEIAEGESGLIDLNLSLDVNHRTGGNGTLGITLASRADASVRTSVAWSYGRMPIAFLAVDPIDLVELEPGNGTTVAVTVSNIGAVATTPVITVNGLGTGLSAVTTAMDSVDAGSNGTFLVNLTSLRSTSEGIRDGTISLHYDDRVLEVPLRVSISHLRAVRLTPAGQLILPTVGFAGSQSTSDRGVVNVTLTNLGTIASTYVLEASSISVSNASWVGGWTVLIDPPTLRLDPGVSAPVQVRLASVPSVPGEPPLDLSIRLHVRDSLGDRAVHEVLLPTAMQPSVTVVTTLTGGSATNVVPGSTVPFDLQMRNPSASTIHVEALLPSACNSTQALSTTLASGETHLLPLQCIVPDTAGPGEFTMLIEVRTDSGAEQLQASVRVERTGPDPPLTMTVEGGPVDLIGSNEGSLRVRLQNPSNGPIEVDLSVLTSNGLQVTVGWDEGDGTDLHLDAGGERMVVISLIDQGTFGGPGDLTILATVRHDGTTSLVENGPHQVDAPSGAALPPSGINLGVTALSNGASLLAVASGWLVVMVLLLLRRDRVHERGRRAPTVHAPSTEEPVQQGIELAVAEPVTDPNATTLEAGNRVTCPSCLTTLGVPRGSTPPFSFACPSCTETIRVTG